MNDQLLENFCNQMFADYPNIVTVKQVQSMLRCSRRFVYALINSGELIAIEIGKGYKIPKLSVIHYLLTHKKSI